MKPLQATLMRARELCLERAHQFLGETEWVHLALAAAGGDYELAAEALELLDAVTPGEDAATSRRGLERLDDLQRAAEEVDILPPQDRSPTARWAAAGSVFSFWSRGGVVLSEDSPERRYCESPIYYLGNRPVAEVAAVIGKACALAAVRTASQRFASAAVQPEQRATPAPRSINQHRAGYVQDPDAEDGE